jgi:hypothetical protein
MTQQMPAQLEKENGNVALIFSVAHEGFLVRIGIARYGRQRSKYEVFVF